MFINTLGRKHLQFKYKKILKQILITLPLIPSLLIIYIPQIALSNLFMKIAQNKLLKMY